MDVTTLQKANELNQKIKKLTEALHCFEWPDTKEVSRNPLIIIEYDDYEGYREKQLLPFGLSQELIQVLKTEIKANIYKAVQEFNEL